MHRAVVCLMMLQATPARWLPRAVHARATAAVPDSRIPVRGSLAGGPVFDAVWLFSGGRSHLAMVGPLGQPVAILRANHGAVGIEFVGEREVLALDAERALGLWTDVSFDDLGRLALGYLPADAGPLHADGQGWWAAAGSLHIRLDREGEVTAARVGDFVLRHDDSAVLLETALGRLRLELGPAEPADFPERAFTLAQGNVPAVSLHRAQKLLAERMGTAKGEHRW